MIIIRNERVYSWRGREYGEAFSSYALGYRPPNYPVPSLLGVVTFDYGMVCMYGADLDKYPPLLTYYDESLGLPLPEDHGIADYTFSH